MNKLTILEQQKVSGYEYKIIGQTRFSEWLRNARKQKTINVAIGEIKEELINLLILSATKIPNDNLIGETRFKYWIGDKDDGQTINASPLEIQEELVKLVQMACPVYKRYYGLEFQCASCYGVFPIDMGTIRSQTNNKMHCKLCADKIFEAEDKERMRKNKGLYF
jgi:hypothetical protein